MTKIEVVEKPKPQFDFTKVNYGWSKQWMSLMSQMASVSVLASNSVELTEDAQPTDKARLNLAQVEAVGKLSDLQSKRDAMLVQTVVSIPRHMLDENAPDDLTFDKPEDLDWLKSDESMNALIQAMNEAKTLKAKN